MKAIPWRWLTRLKGISAPAPEDRLRDAVSDLSTRTMSHLTSLVDPKFNDDDVTVLLVKRMVVRVLPKLVPAFNVQRSDSASSIKPLVR